MKTRSNLKTIADEFNNVVEAEEFKDIKNIRDDFVHNKSGSHTGMATKKDKDEVVFSYYAEGISTEKTYQSMLSLIKLYEPLCKKLNEFFKREIVTYM